MIAAVPHADRRRLRPGGLAVSPWSPPAPGRPAGHPRSAGWLTPWRAATARGRQRPRPAGSCGLGKAPGPVCRCGGPRLRRGHAEPGDRARRRAPRLLGNPSRRAAARALHRRSRRAGQRGISGPPAAIAWERPHTGGCQLASRVSTCTCIPAWRMILWR